LRVSNRMGTVSFDVRLRQIECGASHSTYESNSPTRSIENRSVRPNECRGLLELTRDSSGLTYENRCRVTAAIMLGRSP
jgi:hypothetical protein